MLILECCSTSIQSYRYTAVNQNCGCEEYVVRDEHHAVEYRFRARYAMNHGVATHVELEFINLSSDTLFLDPGVAKITSRNVAYRFNDKFIPLPHLIIKPGHTDNVIMTGSDISQEDDWNKIAGEQLTITIKGLRLGTRTLVQQSVTFVPDNPKLNPVLQ